jgi:hypothetical protein
VVDGIEIDDGYIAAECHDRPPLSIIELRDDAIVLADTPVHYRTLCMMLIGCVIAAGVIAYCGWMGYELGISDTVPTLSIVGYMMAFIAILLFPAILFIAIGIVGEVVRRPPVRLTADGWSNEYRWLAMTYGDRASFGSNAAVVVFKTRARSEGITIAVFADDEEKEVIKIYEGQADETSAKMADDFSRVLKRQIYCFR